MKNQMKVEKFEFEKIMETDFPLFDKFLEAHIGSGKEEMRTEVYFQLQRKFTRMLVETMDLVPFASAEEGAEAFKDRMSKIVDVNVFRKKAALLHDSVRKKVDEGMAVVDAILEMGKLANLEQGKQAAEKDFRFVAAQEYIFWLGDSGALEFKAKADKKGLDSLTAKGRLKYQCIQRVLSHIPEYVTHMERDMAAVGYAKAVHDILRSPKKNMYVVAKDFFDDFKNVGLKNLTFDHLPKDFCGSIRFPYFLTDPEKNHNFKEVVVTVKNELVLPGDLIDEVLGGDKSLLNVDPIPQRSLMFAWYDLKPSVPGVSYFRLCEEFKGQTLEEAWIASSENERQRHPYEKPLDEDFSYKKLLINMLVYIHTGKPDIRSFKNHIRYDSVTKKPKSTFTYLTEKDVTLVGYNWKKPPNYSSNMWYSKPHLGWRWCGVGRTEMRLVWVRGALKSRKAANGAQEEGEELIEDTAGGEDE